MSHTAPPGPRAPVRSPVAPPPGPPLSALVADWCEAGIISPEQGRLILARSAGEITAGERPPRAGPIIIEGLGYLGGVVVVAGCVLLASLYWADLSHWAQVGLLAAAALALVAAGAAVPQHLGGVAVRLRSALWVGGTASFGAALGLYAETLLPDAARDHGAVLACGGALLLAGCLWSLHRVLLQQVAMMGLLAATVATAIADLGSSRDWPGVGVWGVGLLWLLLGWTGALKPPRAARALGAATAIFGTLLTTDADAGMVLMLVTTLAVVALALVTRDLALLVVGAVGLLQAIPSAVNRWFPNSLVAALALLVVGGGLVGAAIRIARTHESAPRRAHDH